MSYGFNGNSIAGTPTDKIVRPSAFILFAPAQASGSSVDFTGLSGDSVTVWKETSSPGGTAEGGTHSQSYRTKIEALFADLHAASLSWDEFIVDRNGRNGRG